ncbi:MAG: hypothetical protein LBV72_19895 [Tannerella sp.]|nr:hypothetical protein [Tannerella sp.]
MKRILLSAMVLMGIGSSAIASSVLNSETSISVVQTIQEDYKEVSLESLNIQVQAAIKAFNNAYEVKNLEYKEDAKLTRVTLTDKESKAEKVVILDDEGQEVK